MLLAAPLQSSAGAFDSVTSLLAALVAIFVTTKLLGEIAQRLGQPTVLGELVAGVLLGGSALHLVNPADPVLTVLAEIGVIVLLFETGLRTELRSLLSVGREATTVALAGVIIPFALGYASALAFGLGRVPALVGGAALCATSVGISARVLSDLGCLESPEGRVVLGAAVLDDIVGLVILAVVAEVVSGQAVDVPHVLRISLIALLFFAGAILIGTRVAPPAFGVIERIKSAGALGVFGLAFAFALAVLAKLSGSALIIGAFAAGLVLFVVPQKGEIEKSTTTIGHFFVPIFFASVGAAVDLSALANPRSLGVGAALIICGIIGKVAAGYVPWWFRGRKLLVGTAMVPRGEVGLIFAQLGLSTGAIDGGLFGAIMLMVLVTTLVTPPTLNRVARATSTGSYSPGMAEERAGEGGIDDLVAGASQPEDDAPQGRSTKVIRPR